MSWDEIASLKPAEILAVLTGIIFVVLSIREKVWCWFWGILSSAFWAWSAYFDYRLYSEVFLQFFYIGFSIWGWINWGKGELEPDGKLDVTNYPVRTHIRIMGLGWILTGFLGYYFDHHTDAALPYTNAATAVYSVIATWLSGKKKLENWIYWIVIDLVSLGMYWHSGSFFFPALFVYYLWLAIMGYHQWRKNLVES